MTYVMALIFVTWGTAINSNHLAWMFFAAAGVWALLAIADAIRDASKVKR